jgi:hypothetical protein
MDVRPVNDDFFRVALLVIGFFYFLVLFKSIFSYARWVFPLIEYVGQSTSSALRHRFLFGAICVGAAGSAVWDLAKRLFL